MDTPAEAACEPHDAGAGRSRPGHGKVALVTGSARRLGRAIVERLAADGWTVWVHYRGSEAEAREVAKRIAAAGGSAHLVQGDVGAPADVAAIVETITAENGRLDLLVNNVGEYRTGDLLSYSASDFEETLRSNLLGAFYLCQACLPLLTGTAGQVVNVGYTGLAALAACPTNTAYVISKTGLLLLTRTYAELLGPRGVRVNMVSPGQLDNSVDLPDDFAAHVALRRPGHLSDVTSAIAFLVSDDAAYITGQNLEVAGGYMMRLVDHGAGR